MIDLCVLLAAVQTIVSCLSQVLDRTRPELVPLVRQLHDLFFPLASSLKAGATGCYCRADVSAAEFLDILAKWYALTGNTALVTKSVKSLMCTVPCDADQRQISRCTSYWLLCIAVGRCQCSGENTRGGRSWPIFAEVICACWHGVGPNGACQAGFPTAELLVLAALIAAKVPQLSTGAVADQAQGRECRLDTGGKAPMYE